MILCLHFCFFFFFFFAWLNVNSQPSAKFFIPYLVQFCFNFLIPSKHIELLISLCKILAFMSWYLLGVRPSQRILEPMTWCMQLDFYPLNLLSSADVPCLTCSLKLTGYFVQRYVKILWALLFSLWSFTSYIFVFSYSLHLMWWDINI